MFGLYGFNPILSGMPWRGIMYESASNRNEGLMLPALTGGYN